MSQKKLKELAVAMKKLATATVLQNSELAEAVQEEITEIDGAIEDLQQAVEMLKMSGIEGYLRVAGSENPALSYKHYAFQDEGVQSVESVFAVFYPCLVGNNLTGDVGKVKHVLSKLGARRLSDLDTVPAAMSSLPASTAVWLDLEGEPHLIDGSEGDVFIVNTVSYWQIAGHYTVGGTTLDVFLRSRSPFKWNDITAEEVQPFGWSPDYCVAHNDSGTTVMHSVYNPSWGGSYSAPVGIAGKYVVTMDDDDPTVFTETYDSSATLLGGSGGLHSTNLALYTGEQYAMNMQGGSATVPYFNHTARGTELLWAGMVAEGGTFDAHNASLMGSGFCGNDAATSTSDWDEGATGAKNGARLVDKDGAVKMYSLATNAKAYTGNASDLYYGQLVNEWRNPWHIMEAHRALCYAIANGVGELDWFAFEGSQYKWRSITGFAGPAQGEMTAVVFKMVSGKMTSRFLDPTDKATSLEGNRIDLLYSSALYHGMLTQVSPSWWTSGLLFTEDSSQNYEAYIERDQSKLGLSPTGDKATSDSWPFETAWKHVGSLTYGQGYRKNYHNDAFMMPDTNANKTGAALHTYVGGYNWFTGGAAPASKKSVRGFRRGNAAVDPHLSPLAMYGNGAPSGANSHFGFGTCVRIAD